MNYPCRRAALLAAGMLALPAGAAETVAQTSSFASLMQALLGLLVVLGMLYLFFWLLRRYGPGQGSAQGVVKVVGGVMLGPRERLVVVEVRDTWLLVGVAAGHVSLLHSLERPDDLSPAAPLPGVPPFAAKLAELVKRAAPGNPQGPGKD